MTQVEAADFVTLLRSSFSALEVRLPQHPPCGSAGTGLHSCN